MATTKLYLDLRSKAKDGKGVVLVTVAHNRTTTTVSTGIRLSPNEWNGSIVINRPDASLLNAQLIKIKNDIDTQIAILQLESSIDNLTAPQLKALFGSKTKKAGHSKHSISDLFDEYLDQDLSSGTKGLYRSTLNKIIKYSGLNTSIEDINYKWLLGFERFLSQSQGVNGRAIHLRNLRAICNHAVKLGYVSNYAFRDFSVKQEQTMKRNVSIEKLRELYYFDCKPYQVVYRDFFFLMFFLIGINAKDLFLAKPDAIQNGRFEYIRAKTHKKYSIKIEPEAQVLLDKYKGEYYLVNVMDRCKDYINFLHEMNDALGQIGHEIREEIPDPDNLFGESQIVSRVEPIIPDLTSYFSRHTWATLAYEIGISIDIISQALGHSSGNRTTLIYVKFDQKKVDDANRKVIDYLFDKDGTE